MQQWVLELVGSGKCEAITCEHSVNEIYVRPQWKQHLKTVVNVHSSVYGTCRQQLETHTAEKPLRDRLNLPLLYRYEQRYCSEIFGDCRNHRRRSPTTASLQPQSDI